MTKAEREQRDIAKRLVHTADNVHILWEEGESKDLPAGALFVTVIARSVTAPAHKADCLTINRDAA